ncbi:hypothetical protein CgS9114_00005, partial [Corynebacterium glutamicum S9114]
PPIESAKVWPQDCGGSLINKLTGITGAPIVTNSTPSRIAPKGLELSE